MATIFGEMEFFWKLARLDYLKILWVENFNEIAQLRRQKHICVFALLAKIWKFNMAAILGERKLFF